MEGRKKEKNKTTERRSTFTIKTDLTYTAGRLKYRQRLGIRSWAEKPYAAGRFIGRTCSECSAPRPQPGSTRSSFCWTKLHFRIPQIQASYNTNIENADKERDSYRSESLVDKDHNQNVYISLFGTSARWNSMFRLARGTYLIGEREGTNYTWDSISALLPPLFFLSYNLTWLLSFQVPRICQSKLAPLITRNGISGMFGILNESSLERLAAVHVRVKLAEKCWIRNLWDSMTLWWLYDDSMMTLWWLYDHLWWLPLSQKVWQCLAYFQHQLIRGGTEPRTWFPSPVCARRCLHTLGPWDPGTLCPGCRWSEGRCGVAQLCSSHCPKRSPHWVCHVLLFVQRLTLVFSFEFEGICIYLPHPVYSVMQAMQATIWIYHDISKSISCLDNLEFHHFPWGSSIRVVSPGKPGRGPQQQGMPGQPWRMLQGCALGGWS